MGNKFNKKKKDNKNQNEKETKKNDNNEKTGNSKENEKEKNTKEIIVFDENENNNIFLTLLNKQVHSNDKDPIEQVITFPNLKDTIIIASRNGYIKEINDITSEHSNNSNIKELYSCNQKIFSLILLKNSSNRICVGLENNIIILKLKLDGEHTLEKILDLNYPDEGPIYSLLELNNGDIISAGKNITLWKKQSSDSYIKMNNISIGFYKIINLVEIPFFNTILATQENTHIIYLIREEEKSISLVKSVEDIPSIWYKGSAQNFSKNSMLLVGKFELNVIDGENGEKASKYPGIDRGTLLNLTQKNDESDFWIVSDFNGRYFEFYNQEGSDLIFYEKYVLDDPIKWANILVRINDECFAAVNHYGEIFVFKINYKDKK